MTMFDQRYLASLLKSKRGNRGLREVADEMEISASTLSRVENGKMPDMYSFLTLCEWLEVPPAEFFAGEQERKIDTLEQVEMLLRTDFPDDLVVAIMQLLNVCRREI